MRSLWEGTFREPVFWDLLGHRLTELAKVQPGANVLDVGTGEGAVLIPAARCAGPTGRSVGIDISPRSVESTLRQLHFHEIDHAEVLEMDARDLTFADESFDIVLSGFIGWDDVYDFEEERLETEPDAILEMYRVLKPGGLVGISSWVNEEDVELLRCLLAETKGCELDDVPRHYSKETEYGVRELLGLCGFHDVWTIVEEQSFAYADTAEWLAVLRAYGWEPELAPIEADERARETFEREVLSRLAEHRVEAGVLFCRSVVFALGRKPLA